MTLVFLYGPPAAGKLTVARELARQTGFRVFHNHLTIDLAREVFPERDVAYGDLVGKLRLDVFEAAARAGVSLISTFVYAACPEDDAFLAQILDILQRHGGKPFLVQLLPSRDALRERVAQEDRTAFTKIRDWAFLESLLNENDLTTSIPGSLSIDNSDLSPEATVARIAAELERRS